MKDELGDDAGGLVEVLVEDPGLEGGMVARRVGVERPPQLLDGERDLLRPHRACALEHEVLEKVRDPHLVRALVDGGRAHPGPQRNRPYARDVLREYGQAVVTDGAAKARGRAGREHAH